MEERKFVTAEELEAARLEVIRLGGPHLKKAKTYWWIALSGFLGTCVILLINAMVSGGETNVAVFVLAGILTVVFIVFIMLHGKEQKIYMNYLNPFNATYKTQFLPAILEESFEKIYAFEPHNGLSKEIVIKSGIFPSFDYITTNDYLRASHNGMNFEYCDTELQERHEESDSDGGTRTVIDTMFLGVFIIAEFDHFVDTPLYILDGGGKGTVTTESEIFNQNFSVKCENEIDALRILTPEMMDHILKIKEFCKKSIDLAFFDDKIYFCSSLGGDRLEIAGSIDIPVYESRKQVDEDIVFIKQLLDLLNIRNLKSKSSQRKLTDEDYKGNSVYQNEHRG
ncbi:MAG: DUF3137 domain-containing protein [Ruminococcus sp.]|jgi:hypothetical protein|nr:DUF3137 domain-containing protein [Ruminococcus sp.]